jgi:phage/conjugal plasmid C-4 type zinc finger TraR family protein
MYNINMTKDDWEYNNEEEAEMGQLHAIHLNLNAVANVRQKLEKQALQPSLSECKDCGEDIPPGRQTAIPGVTRCIYCQEKYERNHFLR